MREEVDTADPTLERKEVVAQMMRFMWLGLERIRRGSRNSRPSTRTDSASSEWRGKPR